MGSTAGIVNDYVDLFVYFPRLGSRIRDDSIVEVRLCGKMLLYEVPMKCETILLSTGQMR